MTGLQIYTADYDPRHVYGPARDEPDKETDRDPTPVERAVRFGDGPLDLLVEFDDRGGRVVWSFRGKRGSETSRTDYYLADYRTGRPDLFRSLAAELAAAYDDGWIVPHAGDLRWDLGFELWRVPAGTAGLSPDGRERLFARLEGERSGSTTGPVVFEMRDHRSALEVVRAIQESGTGCTVAIGTDGDPSSLEGVDLLLQPGGEANFEPKSAAAERILAPTDASRAEPATTDRTDPATEDTDRTGPTVDPPRSSPAGPEVDGLGLASRLAGAALLVMLVFAGFSFVSRTLVHPITGLATVGGAVGTIGALIGVGYRISPERAGGEDPFLLRPLPFLAAKSEGSRDMTLTVVAYGTFCAFLFPTAFRLGGRYVTGGDWLLDPVSTLPGAALQVPLFVAGLYLTSVGLLAVARLRVGEPGWTPETLRELAVAHLVYGVAVLLATGLADALWYLAIPAINS